MVVGLLVPEAGSILVLSLWALVAPVVAAFNGLAWALASAAIGGTALALVPGLPTIKLDDTLVAIITATAASTAFVSFTRRRLTSFRAKLLGRYRNAIHSLVEIRKRAEVFEKVNRVLENRVSSQKDSITILHDQVKKMASLNLDQALDTILETLVLFAEMSCGSIWRMDEHTKQLVPAATLGWQDYALRDVTLDLDSTIEGYVFRNRKIFSLRMLLDSSEFDRFATDRTVITMPIIIGSKPWGVLTVEDLPFERYSQYTETIIAIMLSLAEPYLRQIMEYEKLNDQNEVDPETGHPLLSILYRTLDGDLERIRHEPGFVSLVILEIANFDDLLGRWGRERIKHMLFSLKNDFDTVMKTKYKAFHFKEDNQLAMLIYDLDQDGTSFFCLDLLTMLSKYRFAIDEIETPVELIVGFSSSTQSGESVDVMLGAAEHLLSVQRL